MRRALIGHTGFVGSNLMVQTHFTDCYHSKNIENIVGQSFDLVVCSGAPAEKWKANQDPDADRKSLKRLCDCLATVQANFVVLISTVDVYGTPIGVDEGCEPDTVAGNHYGNHRRDLERFIADHFDTLVVRLPGLFGQGLKKNVIFDLLHNNRVEMINRESWFQFYDLQHLWRHVQSARSVGLRLIHLAPPPVQVGDLASRAFGVELPPPRPDWKPARYDLRTRHARLFGGRQNYICSSDDELGAITAFVAGQRSRRCA
jgi:nucleoside-diphosphate-sugar epimerase